MKNYFLKRRRQKIYRQRIEEAKSIESRWLAHQDEISGQIVTYLAKKRNEKGKFTKGKENGKQKNSSEASSS